jgi:hypothetical protein
LKGVPAPRGESSGGRGEGVTKGGGAHSKRGVCAGLPYAVSCVAGEVWFTRVRPPRAGAEGAVGGEGLPPRGAGSVKRIKHDFPLFFDGFLPLD